MKNFTLISIGILIGCLTGSLLGFYSAVKLFKVEIDVLGIPYSNDYFIVEKDLKLEDSLYIPAGTLIKEYYSTEYGNRYNLEFWYDNNAGSSIRRINENDSMPVYSAE